MHTVTFEVTGLTSVLMNSPKGMQEAEGKPTVGIRRIPEPADEAESKAYRLPSGQLYLPADQFRAAILAAAAGQKIGKNSAPKHFYAGLFATQEVCELYDASTGDPIKQFEVDIRRAVVQKQGVRRARAKVSTWAVQITFQYDPELLTPEIIEQVFTRAGVICGVGDYRPSKKGPFGRFTVKLAQDLKTLQSASGRSN